MKLKISNVVYETEDAVSIYFKQPFLNKVKYKSGQFLTLCVDIDGNLHKRAYSLNSTMKVDDELSVTIKKVQGGLVSNYLYNNVKVGSKLKVLKPMGNFVIEPERKRQRHIVLFGGGSGITPLLSIGKAILHFEPKSSVSLVYCNKNEGSIIFNQKLLDLHKEFGERFVLVHSLDDPPADWDGYKGPLKSENIRHIIDGLPNVLAGETEFFLCGPEGLMDIVKQGLDEMKVPKHYVHQESFTASTAFSDNGELQDRDIKLKYKGTEYDLRVPAKKSILEAAMSANIDLPYSCRSGMCSTCQGTCVSGEVKMPDGHILSEKELAAGAVLNCIGHPLTDDVVIEVN